jgi:hypothetical protein
MREGPPKISHVVLVDILTRAAEREARDGDKVFTTKDVLDTGRDLGLAPEVVQKALAEHLSRREAKREVVRPFDTRIQLTSTEGRLVLDVPAAGVNRGSLATLGFSVFWLGFIAFWTAGASRAPLPFAAFSIPFWMIGFWMFYRSIWGMMSRVRLELGPETSVLVQRPGFRRRQLPTRELRVKAGRVEVMRLQSKGQPPKLVEAVQIECGTRTYPVLVGFSDAERRWVRTALENWLVDHR